MSGLTAERLFDLAPLDQWGYPQPVVQPWLGYQVVRDDLLHGGTKRRLLQPLLKHNGCDEAVFASPAEGHAQLAIALGCADAGARATIFVAKRRRKHRNTLRAIDAGAQVVEVEHGRLNVVQARARAYAGETPSRLLLPLGLARPEAEAILSAVASWAASATAAPPPQVWCAVGAGLLARSMRAAWPEAEQHCVVVGRMPRDGDLPAGAHIHVAPETFAEVAELPPPWPSSPHYDAKIWRFLLLHGQPGALVWNVAV